MPSSRILRGVALLGVAAMALVGCSDAGETEEGQGSMPQGTSQRVTLGTKNFTESVIMGELYAQALSTNGYQVTLRKNVGPTEVIDEALQDGDIDGYPEYLGVAATVLAGEDVLGMSEEETASVASDFYESRGQTLSEQTPFEDVDAIATTTLFAQENALQSIADLRELDSFTLGARPEFEERQQGFAGMQNVYGLTNGVFTPIDIEATYNALFQGDVDTANVFSTDAQLESGDYRVLEDTERIFGYQHVALVIDEDKLSSLGGDEFMEVINDVNSELTQDVVIEMNGAVNLEERNPEDVATQFLRDRGLLTS